MKLFQTNYQGRDPRTRYIYALFELTYTFVDFTAAACFVAGSVMFLYESLKHIGTWCFVLGSVLFAVKPTIRMCRELYLAARGDSEDLADRLE